MSFQPHLFYLLDYVLDFLLGSSLLHDDYHFDFSNLLTFSAIFSEDKPYFLYNSCGVPDSAYESFKPIFSNLNANFPASVSATAVPNPPIMLWSSAVITTPVSFASLTTNSSSSGLIV